MSGELDREGEESRPELDLESAFAAIVAHYGDPVTGEPWHTSENLSPEADRLQVVRAEPVPAATIGPGAVDAADPPEFAALDEHFVPEEPPPIGRGDLVSRLAWAAIAGGPLTLLIAAMVGSRDPLLMAAAAIAFVGGFVVLVARMPDQPGPDDDQDGAVL